MTLVLPSLSSPIKLLTLFHSQREDRQEMIRAVAFVLVPSINKHFWTETHSSSPTVILSARTLNNLIACIPLLTRCVCEGEKGTDTSNQKEESKESISEWYKNSETKWDRDKESSVVVLGFHYPSLSRTIWECCRGSRNWPERVDWWCVCHCFLSIINSLFHRSARDIILPCTVAQCWSTQ